MLGKTRRPEMLAALCDYVKRIGRACPIEVTEVRDGDAAMKKLEADRAATALLLDAGGKTYDSMAFAKWLGEQRDRGTREVIFVCGDADGFPDVVRTRDARGTDLSGVCDFGGESVSEVNKCLATRVKIRQGWRTRGAAVLRLYDRLALVSSFYFLISVLGIPWFNRTA
jgi:23S rRNA (pseudouridine1915-N3)-methyltransferase